MLILTRSPRESFAIGSNVIVTVSSIHANSVRLAIEAPRTVAIIRDDAITKRVDELCPLVPSSMVVDCVRQLVADGLAEPAAIARADAFVGESLEATT